MLQALHRRPSSRAELAVRTGLTKATVSALVAELLTAGLVDESPDPVPTRTGRPPVLVQLSGRRVAALGLELAPDGCRAIVVDLAGAVRHDATATGPPSADPVAAARSLASLARGAQRAATAAGLLVAGTVVAVPGLVDEGGRAVLSAPNLGWHDVALATRLERSLGADPGSVRLDNEANLAALAHVGRVLAPEADLVVVSAGVGVGAGVVLGGRLFRGAHGFGGELGHLVVDPSGRRCRCGNRGCLETVVGLRHVLRAAGVRAGTDPEMALRRVVARLAAGDVRARDALDQVALALTDGLAAAVDLLDPDAVVLAGWPVAVADHLLPRLERDVTRRVLGARVAGVRLVPSPLGDRAAVAGAARVTLDRVLEDPLAVVRAGVG
ncbi:MAG: ROK family transcriptional regulator [Acidimicrobiales bacterium]